MRKPSIVVVGAVPAGATLTYLLASGTPSVIRRRGGFEVTRQGLDVDGQGNHLTHPFLLSATNGRRSWPGSRDCKPSRRRRAQPVSRVMLHGHDDVVLRV